MVQNIKTCKASPVGDREVPSLIVEFSLEVPESDNLKAIGNFYRNTAKDIVNAMGKSIPGGLFDAILVEMMRAKVSLFRVPHFDEKSPGSISISEGAYVLWWKYDDGSGAGVLRIYKIKEDAEAVRDLLVDVGDSCRQFFVTPVPVISEGC